MAQRSEIQLVSSGNILTAAADIPSNQDRLHQRIDLSELGLMFERAPVPSAPTGKSGFRFSSIATVGTEYCGINPGTVE